MGRRRQYPPQPKVTSEGKVRVWWGDRYYYLGNDSDPAGWRAEYRRLLEQWDRDPFAPARASADYLLSELCRDYLASDAVTGAERGVVGTAVRLFLDHHPEDWTAAQFGPRALADWQARLGRAKTGGRVHFSRSTITRYVGIVRRMFRWGVATERIEEPVYRALLTVPGPRRTEGREPKRVQAADPKHVQKCLPHLRGPVRAMVELQLLTGMRPSELFRMTPGQVYRRGTIEVPDVGQVKLGSVWLYLPTSHKTERYGKVKWVVLGPRAQRVLRPFLARPKDRPCFSPREAVKEMRKKMRANRKADPPPSRLKAYRREKKERERQVIGDYYTRQTYLNAVIRAARAAGVPRWTPYDLRRRAITDVDDSYGLDAAQAFGGHASPQTTRRYAKRSFSRAVDVARKSG